MISTQGRWEKRYMIDGDRAVGRYDLNDGKFRRASNIAVERLFQTLEDHKLYGKNCLDLGCGIGRLTRTLELFFTTVTGIDIVPAAIERAKQNNPEPEADFSLYDGLSIPFGDGCFDLVLSWTVLQHVPNGDVDSLSREIVRVMAPGATLLLYENISNLEDKPHIWFRDVSRYERLFDGLKLQSSTSFSDKEDRGETHGLMVFVDLFQLMFGKPPYPRSLRDDRRTNDDL